MPLIQMSCVVIAVAASLFQPNDARAQIRSEWSTPIASSPWVPNFTTFVDGDRVIAGGTFQTGPTAGALFAVAAVALDGRLLWQIVVPGPTAPYGTVARHPEGGYVAAFGLTSTPEGVIIRISPDGQILWERRTNSRYPQAVAFTANGDIVTLGTIQTGPGLTVVVKLNARGEELWTNVLGVGVPAGLALRGSDAVVVRAGPQAAAIHVLAEDGTLRASQTLLNAEVNASGMTSDGSLIIAGAALETSAPDAYRDFAVWKYDRGGQLAWQYTQRSATPTYARAQQLRITADDSIVASGIGPYVDGNPGLVVKLTSNGDLQWSSEIETPFFGMPVALAVNDSGHIAASVIAYINGGTVSITRKWTPDGVQLWRHTVDGCGVTRAMAMDSSTVFTVGRGPGCDPIGSTLFLTALADRSPPAVPLTPVLTRASSIVQVTLGAAAASDGNAFSRWSSEFSDDQWLQVDLGEPTTFDRVHILWEMARASEYEIQTSLDGVSWTTLRRVTGSGAEDDVSDLRGRARYVRMQGLRRATHWGYSLYEFEVWRAGDNIARGRPMTASSAERNTFPPSWAADRNPTTRWSSDFVDEQWIAFDFGEQVAIRRLVLDWETAFASDYEVQVSNDAVGWTTVRNVHDGDGDVDELTNLATTGRYLRLLLHRRGTPWGFSLWEVEVFGAM